MTNKQIECLERQKKRIGEDNLNKILRSMGIIDLSKVGNKLFNRIIMKILNEYPKKSYYKESQDFEIYHAHLIGISLK